MDKIKLAGMVTLYNPTEEDISNIDTYIEDVDILYVIDNTEGKSNKDRLPKNKKIKYIFNNENIGVASALNMSAKMAKEDGYEWILTMDQDTKVNEGVIRGLKEDIEKEDVSKVAILTPWHNTKNIYSLKPDYRFDDPHDVMTSANILNINILDKLGGFIDWFFIDGIDVEYCLRVHKAGYKILRDNFLEVEHNLGDIYYKKVPWGTYLCTNHSAIRRYYMMRNNHYIYDMYVNYDPIFCNMLIEIRHNIIPILFYEKNKYKKLRNYIRGYKDYKKGIKGKYPYKN